MRTLFILLFLACFFSSCATQRGASFVGKLPDDAASINTIAADAVNYITALYPPGRTSLKIAAPVGKMTDPFSQALENGLRARGFTIARPESSSTGAIPLSYTLDRLQQEKDASPVWYLTLRLGDQQVSRVYNGAGLPMAGLSRKGDE